MILYLDTSSLVKVYITEAGSEDVRALVERADFTMAKRAFEADWPRYVVVDATSAICRDAGDLAERYRLRGFDSVHLASFAEVVRGLGAAPARFSSFDDRLNRAARTLTRALVRTR